MIKKIVLIHYLMYSQKEKNLICTVFVLKEARLKMAK